MKIKDIKTYLVGNPWKNWLFVQVETDEGIQGIGEGTLVLLRYVNVDFSNVRIYASEA